MMRNLPLDRENLISQLKHLVTELFRLDILDPEQLSDHEPLQGGTLDLDSIDTLELSLCIEESFGLAIFRRDSSPRLFSSIASLARFICENTQPRSVAARVSQPLQNRRPALASAAQG